MKNNLLFGYPKNQAKKNPDTSGPLQQYIVEFDPTIHAGRGFRETDYNRAHGEWSLLGDDDDDSTTRVLTAYGPAKVVRKLKTMLRKDPSVLSWRRTRGVRTRTPAGRPVFQGVKPPLSDSSPAVWWEEEAKIRGLTTEELRSQVRLADEIISEVFAEENPGPRKPGIHNFNMLSAKLKNKLLR